MNGKERVKAVLGGRIPDKIPYGEFAIDFDTVEKILGHETYFRAKAKSQIALWEGRRDEVVQSWKEDAVELYKKLECIDIINAGWMTVPPKDYVLTPPKKVDKNTWEDENGKVYKFSDITADITITYDPGMWTREYSVEDYALKDIIRVDESVFEVFDYVASQLGKDKFVLGPNGGEAAMVMIGGMERGLTEYMLNPDIVDAAHKQALHSANQMDAWYIRPGCDGIMWGIDFSYNSGPMLSPNIFREICLPVIKARVKNIKNNYNKYIIKHACGNNWKLLDMFVEAGYDCYQSIQSTAGMDIKEVKEKYNGKINLWGGVAVEHLVSGTTDDIIHDVNYAVKYAALNGGYIFGASHSIAVGTKYDNYMVMLDEFERLRNVYS